MDKINTHKNTLMPYAQAKPSLRHLSLKFQTQRMSLQDFMVDLLSSHKPLTKKDLKSLLMTPPLCIEEAHAERITHFVFGIDSSVNSKELGSRFGLCLD